MRTGVTYLPALVRRSAKARLAWVASARVRARQDRISRRPKKTRADDDGGGDGADSEGEAAVAVGGDEADDGAEQAEGDGCGQEGVAHGAFHTFSTSARPRMPVGMKISTMIRIEKAATSLYSTLK